MTWSLTDLIICALAVNQAVEVWHHSDLFERSRNAIAQWLDDDANATPVEPGRLIADLRWWWYKVRMCPWCFSVPLGCAAVICVEFAKYSSIDAWLCWPLYALAISRCANLINDVCYPYLRTPRTEGDIVPVENAGDDAGDTTRNASAE